MKITVRSPPPIPRADDDDDDDNEAYDGSEMHSTELSTLLPDPSSDDEISLSDSDGIALNVVSFGRGIPDKVGILL